jgi:hypothetical protein
VVLCRRFKPSLNKDSEENERVRPQLHTDN